jgi:PRTRC genetic system protein E
MIIDFIKLSEVIPEKGSVTFTVKQREDGKLTVVYMAKHNLKDTKSSYNKEVKDELEVLKEAKEVLAQPIAFTGTAEELNENFEEGIKKKYVSERTLECAINDRAEAINEKIAALDTKKSNKTACKPNIKPTAAGKTEDLAGSLFSRSVSEASAGSDEKAGDDNNIEKEAA